MHLLPGYQSSDYICKAFIICLPPPESSWYDVSKESQIEKEVDFIYDLCYSEDKKTVLKPTDCEKLKELPLGNNCLFNEMEFNFIAVPLGSDHVNLNVHDYI